VSKQNSEATLSSQFSPFLHDFNLQSSQKVGSKEAIKNTQQNALSIHLPFHMYTDVGPSDIRQHVSNCAM
jgi:hypothetical protein